MENYLNSNETIENSSAEIVGENKVDVVDNPKKQPKKSKYRKKISWKRIFSRIGLYIFYSYLRLYFSWYSVIFRCSEL